MKQNMDASRPQLWRTFWGKQTENRSLLHRLVWLARGIYSIPTAKRIAVQFQSANPISILEVGCGSATTTRDICEILPAGVIVGTDIVASSLPLARARVPLIQTPVSDARQLPFRSDVFDLCFSIGLIEHFERDVALGLVREMARVAARGGLVATTVPSSESVLDLGRKAMGKHWPFGTEYPFRRDELRQLFDHAGLVESKVFVIRSYRLLAIGRKAG